MAPPPLQTQVNRGVAWAAGAQAVIAITDLVSQLVVLAVWVGSGDYGTALAAITFYVLLDTAADFGVTSALIQRDDHSPAALSTLFWFNVLISGGLFLILLIIGPLYGHLQDHSVVGWLLIAYGGKLLFQNVYAIPFALLRKELRFGEIAKARMIAHVAESIARVVFAALGLTVWCWTLAALTRSLLFGVIIQWKHAFIPRWVFRPREVLPFVRFGLRSAASQILFRVYTSLDQAIVMYMFGKVEAGIYGLALFIILEPVKTISNVVIDVAFPAFAAMRNDRAALADQLIRFTRLNLLVVLPFVVLILLVIPEALHVFYGGGQWTPAQLDRAADAARILCVVGTLRALAFLGPPLLDGIGRPELTLRYMVAATIAVPLMFIASSLVLGDQLGMLSVAIAWCIGYPLAFIVLGYLVVRTIHLPVASYLRQSWGIIGCCLAGLVAGAVVSYVMPDASDLVRMNAIGDTALAVTLVLVVVWQKITPRSVMAAIKGTG